MIGPSQLEGIAAALPVLRHAGPDMSREFRETADLARLPSGRGLSAEGDRVDSIALLASGVVRVQKIAETGREITLFRFDRGESCILTANAILSGQAFPALATVDRDAEAVIVPAASLRDWVTRHDLWRTFVFDLLSQRLAGVMTIVDEVAFQRMDVRLASLLVSLSRAPNPIRLTHQELAAELGSSREVIRRWLADLACRGIVQLARGAVLVSGPASLRARADV